MTVSSEAERWTVVATLAHTILSTGNTPLVLVKIQAHSLGSNSTNVPDSRRIFQTSPEALALCPQAAGGSNVFDESGKYGRCPRQQCRDLHKLIHEQARSAPMIQQGE